MTPARQALGEAAGRLRRAVESGSFEPARTLLAEYAGRLEEAARELPAGGAGSVELAREARDLLEWARRMALASRAAAATRFGRLPRPVRAYRPVAPPTRHTFELRA